DVLRSCFHELFLCGLLRDPVSASNSSFACASSPILPEDAAVFAPPFVLARGLRVGTSLGSGRWGRSLALLTVTVGEGGAAGVARSFFSFYSRIHREAVRVPHHCWPHACPSRGSFAEASC